MKWDMDFSVLIISSISLVVLLVLDFKNFLRGITFNFGNFDEVYRETTNLLVNHPLIGFFLFAGTIGIAIVVIYGNVGIQETEVLD